MVCSMDVTGSDTWFLDRMTRTAVVLDWLKLRSRRQLAFPLQADLHLSRNPTTAELTGGHWATGNVHDCFPIQESAADDAGFDGRALLLIGTDRLSAGKAAQGLYSRWPVEHGGPCGNQHF